MRVVCLLLLLIPKDVRVGLDLFSKCWNDMLDQKCGSISHLGVMHFPIDGSPFGEHIAAQRLRISAQKFGSQMLIEYSARKRRTTRA
jgi:hypothetical protein